VIAVTVADVAAIHEPGSDFHPGAAMSDKPSPPASRPPASRRRVWLLAALVAVVLAGAGIAGGFLAGRSGGHPEARPSGMSHTIDTQGKLTTPASSATIVEWVRLHAADTSWPCTPADGYADVTSGAQVTVTDDTGRSVAVGQLDVGVVEKPASGGFPVCAFSFHVDVPAGHPLYGVEVGHRGKVTFTARQLATSEIEMSLG
jgi:hypothetical protein